MVRCWILILMGILLTACGGKIARMEHPDDPQGPYRDQIAAARRLLDQKETWANRVEWEVLKSGDGWQVVAWRIEHPERTGPSRYLPWGYSVIEMDSRLVTIGYHRKG